MVTTCALAMLTACGAKKTDAADEAKTGETHFALKVGDRTVQVRIAALSGEQERGLMFVKSMGADEGMLFVFTRPQPMSFWMRNTEIPLDIGYFAADGELKEMYPMYPHDEKSVASRSRTLQFALEMNQGWFKQNGVKPGAKLDLKGVADALRARGFNPEAAGLH